jgi:hypothetical protein
LGSISIQSKQDGTPNLRLFNQENDISMTDQDLSMPRWCYYEVDFDTGFKVGAQVA